MVAVDVRERDKKVENFMKRHKLTFPALLDSYGRVGAMYGARGLPITFLIDRQGKVIGIARSYRDWYSDGARNLMQQLWAEGESASRVEDEEAPEDTTVVHPPLDLTSMPGPPIFSRGQKTVKGRQTFDLDEGVDGDDVAADFSWSPVGLTTCYLIPQNGAEFSHQGIVDRVTFKDMIEAAYSISPIKGSVGEDNRLKTGTILFARTNGGRYACLRIDSCGQDLGVSWVTYERE